MATFFPPASSSTFRASFNLSLSVAIVTNWNFLQWPFKTDRAESTGLGGSDVGLDFLKCGANGNSNAALADTILFVQGNSWKRYYLLDGMTITSLNSRWWDYMKGGLAGTNLTLQAGQGFYYFHRGIGFTWTNNYGP